MLPVINIGPLVLQTPGLVTILGIWLAMTAVEKYARRIGRNVNQVSNLMLIGLIAGILGARLSFAASNLVAFQENYLSILSLSPTMLDPIGGTAVGLIAGLVYGQRQKMTFWETMDLLTPGFAVFMVFLGLSKIVSGEGYGTPTNLPWGVPLWGEKRHPVQVYSILGAGLIILLLFFRREFTRLAPGGLFLGWLSMSSFTSILFETFRGDSIIWAGGIRAGQVLAWVVLAITLVLLGKRVQNGISNLDLTDVIRKDSL